MAVDAITVVDATIVADATTIVAGINVIYSAFDVNTEYVWQIFNFINKRALFTILKHSVWFTNLRMNSAQTQLFHTT